MTLSDFDFILPPEKIAQTPCEPRDHCKLLLVNCANNSLSDKHFYDLKDILTPNDVLVLNETKVFPARLFARNPQGKSFELLLERELSLTPTSITFQVLSKPGLKLNEQLTLADSNFTATCISVDTYMRQVRFDLGRDAFFAYLSQYASTPIPPYISWDDKDEKSLREKYQTVYAKHVGAVAAPTAGLHFTQSLLNQIKNKGIQIEYVTLHVGAGTFLPVKTDDVTLHTMHSEWYALDQRTANALTSAKLQGKRIIAVGTTTIRVLETCVGDAGVLNAGTGLTNIFIYPPYKFKFVDGLITNFHTPKSTLLMLVTALAGGETFHNSQIGRAYEHALTHDYHFYSFGDAMMIV